MKLKKIHIMVFIGVMFLCFFGNLFSITEEETQKIRSAIPEKRIMQSEKSRTVLVFSLCNGFKHSSISYWQQALDIMGKKTGAFKVIHSSDMSVFTTDSLKQFDVICFNNTTHLIPDNSQQKAIMDFIKGGKGIVGIHAATDNFYEWPEGMEMMGGVFTGHPWTADGTWAVKIDDADHPLMKSFKGRDFKINDEIYRTSPPLYSRENQRVLMSLDMSDEATKNVKGVTADDRDTGISWIKTVGKGRLFYCSLGHNNHLTWNRPVLEHYLAGIQYAIGDLQVDDSPRAAPPVGLDVEKLDSLIEAAANYDWDQSRASLVQLHTLIQQHDDNPKTLKSIEMKLISALDSKPTLAATDFLCRELAVIGTEQSISVLVKMLSDESTTNPARYALEKIPVNAVDDVLIRAVKNIDDTETQIGLITTLGNRRSETTVAILSGFARQGNNDVATVALQSLGSIGSEEATESMQALESEINPALRNHLQDALLRCAFSLAQKGRSDAAHKIYLGLYHPGNPSLVQAAALMGLARLEAPETNDFLKKAIGLQDAEIQRVMPQILIQVKDKALLESIASAIPDISDSSKIQVLLALSENKAKVGKDQAVQLTHSDNIGVRMAAYQALEKLGDASVTQRLAQAASQAQETAERQAAQQSLYRLSGKDIDAAIMATIANAAERDLDPKVLVELIRAAAQRQIAKAPEVLFRVAMSQDPSVFSETIRSIQSLAGPEYIEEMVDLLVSRPGTNTQNALVLITEKIPDRNRRAEVILDKYASTEDVEVRISMLRVLGKIGDTHAVSLLNKERASSDSKISNAAFRAMADWPGSDFIEEMRMAANSSPDTKMKILAFRAYIRILDTSVEMDQQQIVNKLIAAFRMAPRTEEQKIVIGTLGHYGNLRGLAFAKRALNETALRAEAEVALIQICEKLLKQEPSKVKPVLNYLKDNAKSESVRNRARELF